jgi:hypothetical protein
VRDPWPQLFPTAPVEPSTRACRYCGAPIRWAISAKSHKWLPLDPDPVADAEHGNFVLREGLAEWIPDSRRRSLLQDGAQVFVAHPATCEGRPR